MEKTTTADRLKQIMQARGLRQVDILSMAEPFCNKYNVKLGRNDLSQYVSGKVIPRQDKLTILGFALNVSEAWLMGYDVPQDRNYTPISDTFVLFDPCSKLFSPLESMRKVRGLSAETVALKICLSVDKYLQIEAGANVDCLTLIRLAEYFCCSTDHLLSFDGIFVDEGRSDPGPEVSHKFAFREVNQEGQ